MLVFIATWTNHLANFGWIVYPENGNGFDGFATDIGEQAQKVSGVLISMT